MMNNEVRIAADWTGVAAFLLSPLPDKNTKVNTLKRDSKPNSCNNGMKYMVYYIFNDFFKISTPYTT